MATARGQRAVMHQGPFGSPRSTNLGTSYRRRTLTRERLNRQVRDRFATCRAELCPRHRVRGCNPRSWIPWSCGPGFQIGDACGVPSKGARDDLFRFVIRPVHDQCLSAPAPRENAGRHNSGTRTQSKIFVQIRQLPTCARRVLRYNSLIFNQWSEHGDISKDGLR